MRYYAVIDTNVLVSAMLKWDSVPGNIMELIFSGTIVPLLHEQIVEEYREVLSRSKFHLTENIVCDVIGEIKRFGIYVDAEDLDINFPDMKDRVFYEVVMEERKTESAYLVTGNIKHFPAETYVVTPRQMLDIIIENVMD